MSEQITKKTLSFVSILFSRTDLILMAFFTILGGFVYGSAVGAAFTLAYTFFALLGVFLGLIPVYGAFLYNGWFQSWLNTTLPQIFGVQLNGLTWFIFTIGLIFTIITTIVVTGVVTILALAGIAALVD